MTISYKKTVEFLTLSPRAGLSYDLFGDGTTALKLSFSRDYESLWTGLYGAGHIFAPQIVEWNWYDLNGDKTDGPARHRRIRAGLLGHPGHGPEYVQLRRRRRASSTTPSRPAWTRSRPPWSARS